MLSLLGTGATAIGRAQADRSLAFLPSTGLWPHVRTQHPWCGPQEAPVDFQRVPLKVTMGKEQHARAEGAPPTAHWRQGATVV